MEPTTKAPSGTGQLTCGATEPKDGSGLSDKEAHDLAVLLLTEMIDGQPPTPDDVGKLCLWVLRPKKRFDRRLYMRNYMRKYNKMKREKRNGIALQAKDGDAA